VVPPCIQDNPEAEDIFFTAIQGAHTYYDRLVALGIRKEDVRFVLPEATATNFVTTVNLRSLAHLYRLRAWEPGAQWEIRNLVREMVRLAQVAVPELGAILQEKRVWLY
jgi:thymidylate synthase (FAD)